MIRRNGASGIQAANSTTPAPPLTYIEARKGLSRLQSHSEVGKLAPNHVDLHVGFRRGMPQSHSEIFSPHIRCTCLSCGGSRGGLTELSPLSR